MKAYVLVTEGEVWDKSVWTPEPNDYQNPNQVGWSWVEGQTDEQLTEESKKRFNSLFKIESAAIINIDGNKGVELRVTGKLSNESMSSEARAIDGTIFRKTEIQSTPGAVIH